MSATAVMQPGNYKNAFMRLVFKTGETYWHGANASYPGWKSDPGYYFDYATFLATANFVAMPTAGNLVITNNGNTAVRNPIIAITAAAGAISSFTIAKAGQTALSNGLTGIGGYETLYIFCGSCELFKLGETGLLLTRDTGHMIPEWVSIEPGANTFSFSRDGTYGDGTVIAFAFDNGWK